MDERVLSPGERMVWAAAFAGAVARGLRRVLAARIAAFTVDAMRDISGDEMEGEAPEVLSQVMQMRRLDGGAHG